MSDTGDKKNLAGQIAGATEPQVDRLVAATLAAGMIAAGGRAVTTAEALGIFREVEAELGRAAGAKASMVHQSHEEAGMRS